MSTHQDLTKGCLVMVGHPKFNQIINNFHRTFVPLICIQCQFSTVFLLTQMSYLLLILCHQRHDFQLKMHHKAFSGWAPPEPAGELTALPQDPLAGFREWSPWTRKRGEGREEKRRMEGSPPLLQTDRRRCLVLLAYAIKTHSWSARQ